MTDAAPAGCTLRAMSAAHRPDVESIYAAGIATGNATFETSPPDWPRCDSTRSTGHRLVAVDHSGSVQGWIAATAVSDRSVYRGVVEHLVYVRPDAAGAGVGGGLLRAFISSTEAAGICTIQSGVFAENGASLRLHAAAGFRVVGTRHRIGEHHGRWRDVTLIERRSPRI